MNALQKAELRELAIEELPFKYERERYQIEDINQANWALRKIAAAKAAIKEREELARAEIERINKWLESETEELQRDIDFFTGLLEEYHREQLAKDSKAKTIKLPYGVLKMRKQQPQYQRDDVAIKEWAAKNRPDVLVPQEPKLDWAALKKSLQITGGQAIDPETGEVVPGITVIEREPKFSVEVK